MWGFFAPAGIPADRLAFVNSAVNKLLVSADLKKALANEGVEPWPLSVSQLSDLLPKEIERYRKIAKVAGIEAE